ncbi:MAG: VRR-NUC domain-containing protein [Pikeienuella sp.]
MTDTCHRARPQVPIRRGAAVRASEARHKRIAEVGRVKKSEEDQIHKDIVTYLRTVLPDAILSHARNEGNRAGVSGIRDGVRGKAMGVCPGYPDLVMYWLGHVFHFEVKAPKGRLSASQTAIKERIKHEGHCYAVVRSVDDVRDRLRVWGIATCEKMVEIPLRGVVLGAESKVVES